MKRFSFTDLNKTPGQILDEAMKGPVTLTKHGRECLVILSAEQFNELVGRDRGRAYSIHDPRAPHGDELGEAIEATLRDLETE